MPIAMRIQRSNKGISIEKIPDNEVSFTNPIMWLGLQSAAEAHR